MFRVGLRALSLLSAGMFGLMACRGDGGEETVGPDGPGVVRVTLTASRRFSPAEVTVDPGMSVRWVNDAEIFHTVTPDDPAQPGAWPATSTSRRGTVLTHIFTQPGRTYAYHCEPHRAQGMTGVIRVRLNPQSVRR